MYYYGMYGSDFTVKEYDHSSWGNTFIDKLNKMKGQFISFTLFVDFNENNIIDKNEIAYIRVCIDVIPKHFNNIIEELASPEIETARKKEIAERAAIDKHNREVELNIEKKLNEIKNKYKLTTEQVELMKDKWFWVGMPEEALLWSRGRPSQIRNEPMGVLRYVYNPYMFGESYVLIKDGKVQKWEGMWIKGE